ncbi:MAG: AsmA family protein [Hyphomicrobiaceae bacterium]
MSSNDWSSREPPRLGPVRPDRTGSPAAAPPRLGHPAGHHVRQPVRTFHAEPDEPPYVRRSGGFGRKAVYAFLGLVGLIAVGVGALVLSPPVDLVRARIVAEVERQTGRKLDVASAGVSFASGLGVSLDRIALSAPPAMGGDALLSAERIDVSLALLPLLLMREVKVDRLTLVKPVLRLRVDREGRRSWDFAALGDLSPRLPVRFAQASGQANDAGALPPVVRDFMRNASPPRRQFLAGLETLSLADVRIVGGTLRYADARSAFAHEMTAFDATVSLPNASGPLSVRGRGRLSGEPVSVELKLDRVRDLLLDRPVAFSAALDGKSVTASFSGKVEAGARPLGEGKLAVRSPSAAGLARLLGLPLSGLDAMSAISVEGQLRATSESVMLTSANVAAGASSGTGTLGLETASERPRLIANLRLAKFDVDQISAVTWSGAPRHPAATAPASVGPTGSAGRFAAPAAAPAGEPPRSITDLLEREGTQPSGSSPATRVKGFRKRLSNQWDVDALDATVLRAFDVEARLHIASLQADKLSAENVQTGIELTDGVLRLNLAEGRIAGGAVRGLASIDAREPSLTVGVNLSGDGLALKPLLALLGVDLIEGNGRVILAVSAKGASERELVSTLAGRAELKVTDGALVGWDADAIVAGLGRGQVPPTERNLAARTPFKLMSGNFNISQGVARSRDLRLDSRTVVAAGTGTINIVDRNVDVVLKPRLASGGIEVPIRIAGHWDSPTLVADVAGALKSPQAQEAARHLRQGDVDGALRSVLGNGPKADEKIGKAKDLLRGLLGR